MWVRVVLKVVFAFPSRDESIDFLRTCAQEFIGCRLLHTVDKDYLVNPVNIVQLINTQETQTVVSHHTPRACTLLNGSYSLQTSALDLSKLSYVMLGCAKLKTSE